jgi:hypothetical protein
MTFYPSSTVLLFVVMLGLLEVGRVLRGRTHKEPNTAIEGALFALFGLLLAFTFSGAMSRYDDHRHLVIEEANHIGTAYLRIDLLPAASQPPLRQLFREYAQVRAHRFEEVAVSPQSIQAAHDTDRLQEEIWTRSVAASDFASTNPQGSPDAAKLLLPAINSMIDTGAMRKNAYDMHPPAVVFILLYVLAAGCALLAGFSSPRARRNWFYMVVFAFIISATIYATLDIEYPRLGLVHITTQDSVFSDLISSMK